MIVSWASAGLGILVIAFIVLVVWMLSTFLHEPEKPEDNPDCWNLMSYMTNGHAEGREISAQRTTSGRIEIEFAPRDVTPIDVVTKNIQNQRLIVDYDKVITLPKGTLSKHKNIKIYLPPNAEDLPAALRETTFGKMMMILIENENFKKTIVEAQREGIDRRDAHLKDMGDGEISVELMKQVKGILTDDLKASIAKASKDTPHTFSSNTNTGGS